MMCSSVRRTGSVEVAVIENRSPRFDSQLCRYFHLTESYHISSLRVGCTEDVFALIGGVFHFKEFILPKRLDYFYTVQRICCSFFQ